jgi:hypothetical protein
MRVSCWGRIWRTAALSGRIAIHAPGGRRQKLQPPLQQEVAQQHRFTMTQFNTRQLELYPDCYMPAFALLHHIPAEVWLQWKNDE